MVSKASFQCFMAWTCIMKSRDLVRDQFKMSIGDGKRTSFWFDHWCGQAPLCRNLEERPWNSTDINKDALVADLISDGRWNVTSVNISQDIKDSILAVPILGSASDKPFWKPSNISLFSNRKVLDFFRERGQVNNWKGAVWFKHHIPRFSFLAWLTILNRLPTRDRLVSWGLQIVNKCLFLWGARIP